MKYDVIEMLSTGMMARAALGRRKVLGLHRSSFTMDFESVWQWFEAGSSIAVLWYGLALAGLIEGVTCLFRFGLGWQATRDTGWLAVLTFGYRIHHGYIGVVLIIPGLLLSEGRVRNMLLLLGIGLLVSDVIHHFLVLWPITGSPEFDIRYPGY